MNSRAPYTNPNLETFNDGEGAPARFEPITNEDNVRDVSRVRQLVNDTWRIGNFLFNRERAQDDTDQGD
jgi:hypothetical protein